MANSISELSKYLSGLDSGPSTELIWRDEDEEIDQELSWNGLSCLSVVSYVFKLCSSSDTNEVLHTIRRLNDLASKINKARPEDWEKIDNEHELAESLVNTFMPKVQKFFSPPERNEHLEDFMYFLLQILNSELAHIQDIGSVPLQEGLRSRQTGLSFLLAALGDTPFQYTEREEVNDLLTEFKAMASETGNFIYSFVFRKSPVDTRSLDEAGHVLVEKIDFLQKKIKDHCIEFPELPLLIPANNPRKSDAADLLFMVDSLLEDLASYNNLERSGLEGYITTIRDELIYSRPFLQVADKPRQPEIPEIPKEWVMQISYTASEADYLINSFVVGDFPEWYLSIRLPTVIQRFLIIKERFNLIRTAPEVNLLELDGVHRPAVEVWPSDSSQTLVLSTTTADDENLVGFNKEMEDILHQLTGQQNNHRTITIYGMSGLGKTTLAKKLYNHSVIRDYFDICSWSVVSQVYSRRKLFTDIAMSLSDMPDRDKILKMELWDIGDRIHRSLTGRRYLIVMDDVWGSDSCHDIRRYLPDHRNGSRILITTQNREVPSDSVCTLPFLSEDQCWELLHKKVFRDKTCPEELECYGKLIASKCDGLPLVVVVIAGILANKPMERSFWADVAQSMQRYRKDCLKIVALSYNHLPNHLKLCFLCFSVFREYAEIPVRKLTWLWIAEGIIGNGEIRNKEEVAREYLNQLIQRSLVIVVKNRSTEGVKACSIHDMIRQMCLEFAKQENFVHMIKDDHTPTPERHHRLAVLFTAPAHLRPFSTHCRSFFGHLSDPSSSFLQMKHTRIMQLEPNKEVSISYKLKRINMLVNLRYLVVDRMPEVIAGSLVHLEVLVVESMSNDVPVPSVILNISKLTHLHVQREGKFQDDCDTSNPNNLQSLSFVSIQSDRDYRVLKSSPHLRKLKCLCPPQLPDFRFLTELESLKIVVPHTSGIPRNIQMNFPSTINKLTLLGTRLPWEMVNTLGDWLPGLVSLKLLRKACTGKIWETSDDRFPKLKFLKLEGLQLKHWKLSTYDFPRLQHLVLHKCDHLMNIPDDVGDIPTLDIIEVHDCSPEARMCAAHIKEEQQENGNYLKVFITKERMPDQGTSWQPLRLQQA